jgi:hypothetical protein
VNFLVILCITPDIKLLIFIQNISCFFRYTAKKYIIYVQILCRVVKCGLDFLETFWEVYDLPQLDIISTCSDRLIFIFFYVVLDRKICEWCIEKDVEGNGHGLF